jgi:hypothetical protein
LKLFGGELVAIDGTKLAAVNARDRNYNPKKLAELIARADARRAGRKDRGLAREERLARGTARPAGG